MMAKPMKTLEFLRFQYFFFWRNMVGATEMTYIHICILMSEEIFDNEREIFVSFSLSGMSVN